MDYKVNLEIYSGPMDLLLYLIKKEELDIYDIPIARITEQYLRYMEVQETLDLERAGEFLVLAATLMHIKSRMLLPVDSLEEEEEEDPRMDLVRQLLEYKRVKEAAQKLSELAESHSRLFPGAGLAPPDEEPTVDLREVDLWDLLAAFQKVMRETGGLRPHEVVRSDVPVDTYIKHLLLILQKHKRVAFHEIFARSAERMHMIGMFLAILELVREGRIFASQNEDFGEIYLGLLGEEPGPSEVRSAEPALSPSTSLRVNSAEGCGVRPDAASGSTQNPQGLSPSPAPEEKTGENAPPQDE